jgi:hypothetical protein
MSPAHDARIRVLRGPLLTKEQQDAVDRRCLAELERLGSDFPYAALFAGS